MLAVQQTQQLPRAPASDVKAIGWRGLMKAVRGGGKLVITNHNEPEAVILSIAEYEAMVQALSEHNVSAETRLAALRDDFDLRLTSLRAVDTGDRLRALMQAPCALGDAIKAGASY